MNYKSNILEDIIGYKKINGIINNILKGIDDISREIIMKNAEIKLEKKPIKNISKKVRKEKRKVKRENDKCINIIIKILIIKISNNRKDTKTVERGQPESAEPEGFSNLKKVNNILVYCGKLIQNKRRPNTLNEELLKYISMKNLYEDTINILNLEREQFNNWKENIIKENELNSSSQSKKINKLNCEIESLKLGKSSNLK
ncbi:hypothetical protein U3516DRAFT_774424 [Neocallimastix sp. 'constans']